MKGSTPMGYIDIGIIGIVSLLGIFGFLRGFSKAVISKIVTILSIVLAILFFENVATWINASSLHPQINAYVTQTLFTGNAIFEVEVTAGNLAENLALGLEALHMPSLLTGFFQSQLPAVDGTLGSVMSLGITNFAIKVLSFLIILIGTYIVAKIVISFFKKIINGNNKVGALDRVLGMLFGAAKGLIIAEVLLAVMMGLALIVAPINAFLVADLQLATEGFSIGKYMYELTLSWFSMI